MADRETTIMGPGLVPARPSVGSVFEVFRTAARLGLTSFGGPVAHLGYFRDEYVQRLRWVDEATFTDLVALSQFLPGPASSKLGISIGVLRAGLPGGLAAWLGFTVPSAVALVLFAFGAQQIGPEADGWSHGLKVVAVAVVALAVWSMARALAFDRPRGTVALASTAIALLWPVWTSAILRPADAALALAAFGALAVWRVPPWIVVVLTAAVGAVISGVS